MDLNLKLNFNYISASCQCSISYLNIFNVLKFKFAEIKLIGLKRDEEEEQEEDVGDELEYKLN